VTYLLDVNVLLALAHVAHPLPPRAKSWFAAQTANTSFASCSITELGFLRVSLQTKLQPNLAQAKIALSGLLSFPRFTRLADDLSGEHLPAYVRTANEITDGHLLALAHRHKALLATLDQGIPGAEATP